MNIEKFISSLSEYEYIELENYILTRKNLNPKISISDFMVIYKDLLSNKLCNILNAIKSDHDYTNDLNYETFTKYRNIGQKTFNELGSVLTKAGINTDYFYNSKPLY